VLDGLSEDCLLYFGIPPGMGRFQLLTKGDDGGSQLGDFACR
jgi:hypothetical protein